jgi:hypothetical protein
VREKYGPGDAAVVRHSGDSKVGRALIDQPRRTGQLSHAGVAQEAGASLASGADTAEGEIAGIVEKAPKVGQSRHPHALRVPRPARTGASALSTLWTNRTRSARI